MVIRNLSLFIALLSMLSCNASDFASPSDQIPAANRNGGDGPGSDGWFPNANDPMGDGDQTRGNIDDGEGGGDYTPIDDGDGPDLDTGGVDSDFTALKPKACTADVGKIIFSKYGSAKCPDYYAAFTSDDGRSTRVGCCPLPVKDILDKDSPAVARGTSCHADEIAVGAVGTGFYCQRINTEKYKLEIPRPVCYWGNGSSGQDGAAGCQNMTNNLGILNLVRASGDIDGCSGFPYGSVIVSKTNLDDTCAGQESARILYRENDQPVPMFP